MNLINQSQQKLNDISLALYNVTVIYKKTKQNLVQLSDIL